jgi:hypothetical protein
MLFFSVLKTGRRTKFLGIQKQAEVLLQSKRISVDRSKKKKLFIVFNS